jgi:hypothetical protein
MQGVVGSSPISPTGVVDSTALAQVSAQALVATFEVSVRGGVCVPVADRRT